MPWVIGAVVAYVGWKFWEQYSADKFASKVWNEAALLAGNAGQVKYPEGGTGYTQYTYPSNVVL